MRRSTFFAVWVAVLLVAPAAHAIDMYVSIVGANQGPFRGELTGAGLEGKFRAEELTWGAEFPRDSTNKVITTSRVYFPVTMRKVWGATSYQLYAAMLRNELLTVTIDFVFTGPDGKPVLDSTVKLVGAMVSKFEASGDRGENPVATNLEFVFTRVELTDKRSNVMQADGGVTIK